jgi:hypothetical protein
MIKGDRIKLVKPIGAFTNVGEICEVIDIAEGGVISFRFGPGGRHLGCMSYDEYLKYFEQAVEEKKPRVWTKWRSGSIEYYDMENERNFSTVFYRHNGKRVQIKSAEWQVKSEASCHNEDEFDLSKGLNLAKMRLIVNILEKQIKEIAEVM